LADRAFPNQNPMGRTISYFGGTLRIGARAAGGRARSHSRLAVRVIFVKKRGFKPV
jgi:hypothetical protein